MWPAHRIIWIIWLRNLTAEERFQPETLALRESTQGLKEMLRHWRHFGGFSAYFQQPLGCCLSQLLARPAIFHHPGSARADKSRLGDGRLGDGGFNPICAQSEPARGTDVISAASQRPKRVSGYPHALWSSSSLLCCHLFLAHAAEFRHEPCKLVRAAVQAGRFAWTVVDRCYWGGVERLQAKENTPNLAAACHLR